MPYIYFKSAELYCMGNHGYCVWICLNEVRTTFLSGQALDILWDIGLFGSGNVAHIIWNDVKTLSAPIHVAWCSCCFQVMSCHFIHLFQNVMVHIMIMIVGVVKLASLKQSDCSGKTHCNLSFFVLINLSCRITLKFTSPRTTNIPEVTCLDMDCGWKHINALKFVETKEMIKGTGHDESQGLGWDVSMLWSWYASDCWAVITKVWICGPWVYCFSAAWYKSSPDFECEPLLEVYELN